MPGRPGAAFDAFLETTAPAAAERREWTDADGPLPSLYLSHGAPPLFDEAEWMAQLFAWAQSLPQPKGIVVVSAHWESAPLMISSPEAATPLVYDFGGFPERYYRMTYETPDASALARRLGAAMPDHEPVHQHASRGLDHGAWVPLKVMYPGADIPVVQMSMPTQDPDRLLELGRRLRPLREEGYLLIGSGFMTHGLPYIDFRHPERVPGWSSDFDHWAAEALERGDVDTLARYRSLAPGMPYAHPTVDHYLPLFVTYGAASETEQVAETVIDGFWLGLAKRSFQLN
ncbi:dioxygenase family protein [Glycomyces buryatensis]|uniref:Dioxygenase n=1 Tax=Glycomyces buryatensis TaxID=2570927 RepID=A0A4V4HSG4_9ACTN|nr:class III extradiol ring-cleavage dioxygenase [Glycomyces buryatensis]THV40816.1 dioxygenase [Glycomyces buryatensis]